MIKRVFCVLIQLLMMMQMQAQQDLTLQQSLQMAKKNNPDLKILHQNINKAIADRETAGLKPNPLFNIQTLDIINSKYRVEGTSWVNGLNNQYWYQMTKPFQIGHLRMNKIRVANQLVHQAQLDFNAASSAIYVSVALKWIDVWFAMVNLDILLKGKKNIDSLVLIQEYRFKKQVIAETDLLRTQLLREQYQIDIRVSRQMLMNEDQNLKYLTGATDSIGIAPEDSGFFTIDYSLDSLLKLALQQRSDILGAKNNLQVSMLNIRLQKSLAYPVPEIGGIYNPQNKIPYIGIYSTVEIPLFDRNQGEREKAKVLNYQAEQNVQATERLAKTEVINAYNTYRTQRNNLLDYEDNLAKTDRVLSNVRYSYLRGATSVIDLLEAERSWLYTRQRYYSIMGDFRRSYVQLLFSIGSINDLAE